MGVTVYFHIYERIWGPTVLRDIQTKWLRDLHLLVGPQCFLAAGQFDASGGRIRLVALKTGSLVLLVLVPSLHRSFPFIRPSIRISPHRIFWNLSIAIFVFQDQILEKARCCLEKRLFIGVWIIATLYLILNSQWFRFRLVIGTAGSRELRTLTPENNKITFCVLPMVMDQKSDDYDICLGGTHGSRHWARYELFNLLPNHRSKSPLVKRENASENFGIQMCLFKTKDIFALMRRWEEDLATFWPLQPHQSGVHMTNFLRDVT
jgi:hypothetical protein